MMKRYFTLLLLCSLSLGCLKGQTPSNNRSYIRTRTFTQPTGTSWLDRADYDNGLGDLYQQVDAGITPGHRSLVTLHEYDSHRRPWRTWLPALSDQGTDCLNDTSALKASSRQLAGNDSRPYSTTIYGALPLNGPKEQYAAGSRWYEAGKRTCMSHAASESSSASDYFLRAFFLIGDEYLVPSTGFTAFVTETDDEDGHRLLEFRDEEDRLLLSRSIDGDESHSTYYVRDDAGRLRYVFSPEDNGRVEAYIAQHSSWPILPDTILTFPHATAYLYDGLGRCIFRRLPGCEPSYSVYDKGGRAIFTQDGVERSEGHWSFSLPDAFGRATVNGVCSNTLSYASEPLRNTVVKATRGTGGLYGYNVSGVSLSSPVVHTVNYYDDYSFIGTNGVPASLEYAAPPSGYGVRYTGGSKGLLTGTVVARLDASGVAGYDYTAYYYDDRGRIVQTRSTNALGGTDIEYVAYNFVGDPVKRRRVHTATGKPGQTEVYSYTYDHAGRLLTTRLQPGSGPEVALVSCTYDDLGRLKTRTPHGIASAKLTYDYNLRGWLTGISGNKFSQNLYYNTGNGTPCYNGNISSMTWQAGGEVTTRGYKFTYDGLNRMLDAVYGEGTSLTTNANRFTEKVTGYDKNGNILALQRYGQTGASSYGLIDNLTLTLDGNQLNRVDDAVTSSAYNNGFEFKDAVKQANEYAYDANGNLTKDLNKNISNIQYNSLNLPSKVTFTDGSTIEYTYAADGTKLKVVHKIGSTTTTTDYCGNVIYENGVQKLLLTEAGYVTLADSKYHYYLQDHQGNNRVVIDQNGAVEEVNHYYPFGGVFASTSSVQPYKYNGKELDTKKGLNWYDYGARHYDAAVGRFATVDPMAEKLYGWAPYAYCYDNPIKHVDKDGKIGETVWDVFSLIMGVESFTENVSQGNIGAAVLDGVGIIADAAAVALPLVPGGAGAVIKGARAVDKAVDAVSSANKVDKAIDTAKSVEKTSSKLVIEIAPENKIDRSLLNPPVKEGNAPTFKNNGMPVEIHNEGQNPQGPFKEMSRQEHRGKGNFKKNHSNLNKPSNIDRNEFKKAKQEYWKKEYGQ